MSQPERPERRAFFRQVAQLAGAAAVTSSGCKQAVGAGGLESVAPSSAPPLPDGLDRTHFHVHNEAPLSLETRREAAGRGLLTPNTRFFCAKQPASAGRLGAG